MKQFLLLTLLIWFGGVACAQDCELRSFEFEFGAGITRPLGGYRGGTPKTGLSLDIRIRYNLESLPIDYGFFIEIDGAQRSFDIGDGYNNCQNNRTLSYGITCAYNFRKCKSVNPFAELGIGVAQNDVVGDKIFTSKGVSAAFIPKIGVEFWHFLRVNCYLQLSRRGYNNFGASLGIVLGGRPR